MNADAASPGDKADDLVSGHGGTALGETYGKIRNAANQNAALGSYVDGLSRISLIILGNGRQNLFIGQFLLVIAVIVFLKPADNLAFLQCAVADGCQYAVPIPEAILMHDGVHVLRGHEACHVNALSLTISVQKLLALRNVLFLALALEPLVDLVLCLSTLDNAQPVAAGAFGVAGGNDLDAVSVLDLIIDGHKLAVDPCAHHLISHGGVNAVGKINGGGTCRQVLYLTGRGEAVYLIREQIQVIFQQVHELTVVRHVLLPLQDLAKPHQLLLLLCFDLLAVGGLFIFPMGGNTILCRLMHFERTDLDLEGLSAGSDQSRMQGLIHVCLRNGNVILKSPGNGLVMGMDLTQGRITILHRVDYDPDRKQVVDLIQGLVLILHLLVDAEEVLHAPVHLCLNAGGVNDHLYLIHDSLNVLFPDAALHGDLAYQIPIRLGLQIF